MCSHNFKIMNDVKACVKCGLTITFDNKAFFDRKLVKYANKKRGAKNDKTNGFIS